MANILRFTILGEDKGGPAFAQFTRQVELASKAVDRNNAALKQQGSAASAARSGISGLAGEVTGIGAAFSAASSGGNKFKLALAALNLASGVLEPAMAGVVVAVGGLAAGLAAAGAGLGAFGLVAKANFSAASTAATQATAAQDAHKAAVAKVTAQYQYAMSVAKTRAQRQAAYAAEQKGFNTAELTQTAALNKAYAGLSPAQIAMSKQISVMKTQWQTFTATFAPMLNRMLTTVAPVFKIILGDIGKLATAGGTALQALLPSLGAAIGSSGFQKFITMLASQAGPAIVRIGVAVGNVVVGIGGILKAFMPTSQQMLAGLDKITAKFREWGTSLSGGTGFASLMATFRTETPQAVAILTNLGTVIANVGKAMFGLSTFSNSRLLLSALTPLSGVMASLSKNTDLVRIAMYALLAVKIGQQFSWVTDAWKGIVKFAAVTQGATVAEVIAAAATRAWGLAMAALPWVALAAAVVAVALLIIKYHTQIWTFTQRVWHDVLAIIMAVWNWVKNNWPLLLGIITGPVGLAIVWIVTHFGQITTAVKAVLSAVQAAWNATWAAIKAAFAVFINAGVIAPFNTITGAVRTVLAAVSSAWNATWNTLKAAFRVFVVDGILGPLGLIVNGAAKAFGWVPGLGGQLKTAAAAFNTFRANVNTALGGINGRTVNVSVAMTSSTNPFPGGISGRKAAGGRITGPGGPRDDRAGLFALSNDEWVIRADSAARYGHAAMDAVNKGKAVIGYAAGGRVSAPGTGVVVEPHTPTAAAVESTLMASVMKLAKAFAATLGGSGSAILAYAESFKGRAPYVWGGNTPAGWDCSGFVEYVYKHFGIGAAGRPTAASFQQWAKASGPTPGGMAFYGTPAHHVGFVVNGSTLLSALGHKYGTIESSLNMGDNSGYGIPPRGFASKNAPIPGGGSLPKGKLQELAYSLLNQYQWANQWAAFNALETREAGWSMTATNPSSKAYGLAQFDVPPGGNLAANKAMYFSYGGNWSTALGQLTAMLNYIANRYPSGPNQALAHEVSAGWYDQGGPLMPGWTMAYNGTGRPEQVVSGDGLGGLAAELRALRGQMAELIRTTAAVPAATGHHVGGAINGAAGSASFRRRFPAGGA